MGMGPFGSFVGLLVVGALVAHALPVSGIFATIGAPGIIAAVTAALVGLRYVHDAAGHRGALSTSH